MAPSKKNVNKLQPLPLSLPKKREKLLKRLSLQTVSPTYPTSISPTAMILIQTPHHHGPCKSSNLNPSSTTNNSSRCFAPYESG